MRHLALKTVGRARASFRGFFSAKQEDSKDCKRMKAECGVCKRHQYMDPTCKLAVITGGSSGIGYAAAHDLLCHDAYRVILASCQPCDGKKAVDTLTCKFGEERACFVNLDVRKGEEFEDVLSTVGAKFGDIDILINAAGVMDDKWWENAINTNIKAVARGIMLGLKYVKSKESGVIVNIASTLSFDAEPSSLPIFTATQHAIAGLTKCFGSQDTYAKTGGTRVVGICPGPTSTELLRCGGKGLDEESTIKTQAALLKNPQSPDFVGRAIMYLIKYASTGTLWVAEGSELFKTAPPKRETYSEKIVYV